MSQKPHRLVLTGLVVVTVALVVVSLGAASYYYTSTSALSAKNQEILRLRITALAENASILQLELSILSLNSNITSLNQEIASLQQSQAASAAEAAALRNSVSQLKNESALLGLELAVAEKVGSLSVLTYFVNDTVTVPPSTTFEVTSQANGYNGTIVFMSPNGCPSTGGNLSSVTPRYVDYIWLSSKGTPLLAYYDSIKGQPFTLYLQNVGTSPVECTFSLFYVRH